ncbi:hypothetical protein K438DRAFT_15111 [Mycena galopus ATCC 62051]|nr:hypothetical protein K438DRAFT_15111 [Mycena galopus ATCC 62051]
MKVLCACHVPIPKLCSQWKAQKKVQSSVRAYVPGRLKRALDKVLGLQSIMSGDASQDTQFRDPIIDSLCLPHVMIFRTSCMKIRQEIQDIRGDRTDRYRGTSRIRNAQHPPPPQPLAAKFHGTSPFLVFPSGKKTNRNTKAHCKHSCHI